MGIWSCEGVCSEWAGVVFKTLAIWLPFFPKILSYFCFSSVPHYSRQNEK